MEKEAALERFCRAVRIRTDWPKGAQAGDQTAEAPLQAFQEFLTQAYPRFHQVAERWVLGPYSVVYRWAAPAGGVPADKVPPGPLILAHYDVVPVEAEKWSADPFGAEIKEGYIYGRGTQDMKGILIGVMEAVEELAGQGFRPKQDIWFAFGGDEERASLKGARNTAAWFRERGLRFSWILDEGTPVAINRGVDIPLALLSVEEKGFLSLELAVDQRPGHASQPPRVQAAVVLARALLRISKRPFPARLSLPVASFFTRIRKLRSQGSGVRAGVITQTGGGAALLAALSPLTAPFLAFAHRGNPQMTALLRTTIAMTQLEGSAADNVMPSRVRAVINMRLLPPWTVDEAINHITWAVGDERVKISVTGRGSGPVPANAEHGRMRGPGWDKVAAATSEIFPDAIVLPFMMTAATDSRNYQDLAEGIFRFNPMRLSPGDQSSVHGHDERISLENFFLIIRFYTTLFGSL